MCFSFPYGTIDQVTSTVSIVPYVTQYEDGSLSTSFSTITFDENPDAHFFDEGHFTWVTHGRTLTYPTTYGSLQDFVGRADRTLEPTAISDPDRDCDGTVGTSAITLPATVDPGEFIIPLGVSQATLKIGTLPEHVIGYLAGIETVRQQFNDIPLTDCLPALPVHTTCTTVLTSYSTFTSCTTDSQGEQSCTTGYATLLQTDTHTPHWPTLEGGVTDLKRTAARLTTTTEEARTIKATAEPALAPTSSELASESENSDSSEPTTAVNPDTTAASSSGLTTATSQESEHSEESTINALLSSTYTETTSITSPELTAQSTSSTPLLTRSSTPSSESNSHGATLAPADSFAASPVMPAWRLASFVCLICLLWQ